nr:chemotaxis protein CheW [Siccirubricoccus soli]
MLGGEALSLPAGAVREVLRPRPLTRLPHAPPSLLGLANHRGMVLPVVSLARLLRRQEQAATPATRLLVLEGEAPVGLLVDAVLAFGAGGTPLTGLGERLAGEFAGLAGRGLRRAGRLAAGREAAAAPAVAELALVTCQVGGQDFAFAAADVVAVARLPEAATPVPHADPVMLGVAAFRGGLLPLVSAHALLGLPGSAPASGRGRILVLPLGQALVGLVVDRTGAMLRLPRAALDPVPSVLSRGTGEARIEGICRVEGGRRLVSLLSPARLFDVATASRLLAGAAEASQEGAMAADGEGYAAQERFVVFRLGEEEYGLPIAAVEEVARHPGQLTRVPHAPAYLEGVMNLRGSVIPVIDQRRRFAAGTAAAAGRVIVVTVEGLRAGFAVDAVTEVLTVPVTALVPAPPLAAGEGQREDPREDPGEGQIFDRVAIPGQEGRMVLLIEPKRLLDAAERDLVAGLAARATAIPPAA